VSNDETCKLLISERFLIPRGQGWSRTETLFIQPDRSQGGDVRAWISSLLVEQACRTAVPPCLGSREEWLWVLPFTHPGLITLFL